MVIPDRTVKALGAWLPHILLAAACLWPAAAAAQGRCMAPGGVAAAAQELSLRDLVSVLAGAGCSGGAIVPDKENQHHLDVVKSAAATSAEPVDVAKAFSARTDWQVSQQTSGLVLLAPASRLVCQSVLERRLPQVIYTGKAFEMESALDRVIRGLEPIPSGKVPVMASGGNPKSATKPPVWEYPVSLNLTDVTVQSALDETVRQVPGLFWVLREHAWPNGQGSCDLILESEDSSLQGGSNLLPHPMP